MNQELYDSYVESVTGKDVIIIGPSGNVFEDCEGVDIDGYDMVCRLNYHWKSISGLGSRIDMIYHCINPDQYTADDLKLWKSKHIPVITPHDMDHYTKHRKTAIFNDRNRGIGFEMLYVPNAVFDEFREKFESNPNTGTLAIIHLLSLPISTLTVVGFDFYSSLYWFNKDESFRNAVHRMPHKPKVQFENFREYISGFDNFVPIGRLKEMLKK